MTLERTRRADFHPLAWATVVCTVLCVFVARPAAADPVAPGIPDPGSRPVASGPFQGPGASVPGGLPTSVQPTAVTPGPLGQQIMTETAAVGLLEQQLLKLDANINEARHAADVARGTWAKTTQDLADLRNRADQEAGEAYKAATALGPLGSYASDLHQLSVLAPGIGQQPGGEATARDLERAEQLERGAHTAYQAASAKLDQLSHDRDASKADYDKRSAALTDLRTRNSVAYQQELAAIDAQQAAIGRGLNVGGAVDGMTANPKAVQAFEAAQKKLGQPYVWGAAGPDFFDCSGLVQWSYRQVGTILPRVANDQYAGTANNPVAIDKLLTGDLLFFATDRSNPRSIHHVGMYAGNGYMIQAPNSGDVVKISPIWWSEYYGATRVYPAVPAAPAPVKTPPPSSPPPSSKPPSAPPSSTPPSTPPSSTPPSKPPSSTSPSASSSASPTHTPAGSGSTSPGGSASASAGGSASASAGASTKASSASPTASQSAS